MDFTLKNLFNILLYTNVLNYLLVLAGIWAVLWWSIDNFRSIVEITKSVLTPYFQPQENKTLVEKYGKWAGKKNLEELRSIEIIEGTERGLTQSLLRKTRLKLQTINYIDSLCCDSFSLRVFFY